jgi:RNA ligase
MKINLIYPKIPENTNGFLGKCVAFEKYDGTNLHWCWDKESGWTKFGTRRTQFYLDRKGISEFSKEHYELGNAPSLFNDKLRDMLSIYLSTHDKYRHSNIIVFTEFCGPNSFGGGHSEKDAIENKQELILIDISVDDEIISPHQLLEDFGSFNLAQVIYTGKYTGQFTEDVRKGKYGVNEGVVCKGMVNGDIFMTKVKTYEYLKRK